MASFKFLHAADLHLDCLLKGLEDYEGAPVERIRNATRAAFENLVTLAIRERVHFVVIAGDLFDRRWTDIQTGLWTAHQFRLLEREGIPVYLLRGNHDAYSEVPQRMSWPANVFEFPVAAPATLTLDDIHVALHGQGFATREVPEDLVPNYPEMKPGYFNIGVLHTSLTGDPRHDTYAPTSEESLVLTGYDYWALGHLHQHRIVREAPCIIFPGCTQGRHILETGPKGCVIVQVDSGHATPMFYATDTLRWTTAEVDVPPEADLSDIYDAVDVELRHCREQAEGRYLAVRVVVQGTTPCHHQLCSAHGSEEVIAEIRNLANAHDDVWIEKVILNTLPAVDLDQLREGDDLIGELLREIVLLQDGSDEELLQLAEVLEPLARKAAAELREAEIDLRDPDNIRNWLSQAESKVVSMLTVEDSSPAG